MLTYRQSHLATLNSNTTLLISKGDDTETISSPWKNWCLYTQQRLLEKLTVAHDLTATIGFWLGRDLFTNYVATF